MTVPDLAQPSGYAHVVVATGTPLLTTAGAVPLDEEDNLVRSGDVRAQARHTLHNLMRQLAVAGASGDDLLETTVYVASTDRADPVACWEEIQRSPLAAMVSTLLGAALLDYADQPDEIEPTAVLPWRDPRDTPKKGGYMTESPARPGSKTELLERMRAGREEWNALIAQIPDSARTEPALAGGWSVKDLIAHVAAFENWTAAQIRAANEGRAPTDRELYGVEEVTLDPEGWDLDRENAAIYARYRDMPLAEVMIFSSQAFFDLVAAVEAVSDEDFDRMGAQIWTGDATLLEIIPGQCYAHYEQHADELKSFSGDDIP